MGSVAATLYEHWRKVLKLQAVEGTHWHLSTMVLQEEILIESLTPWFNLLPRQGRPSPF
jgi:hypothetical protein